ncbi:MAG: DUF1501 domain-containing protein [Casimicrobiaceae bacterium]|nr:DUF1501 domain-containing protein [Casimicrobiaceae bacterium]
MLSVSVGRRTLLKAGLSVPVVTWSAGGASALWAAASANPYRRLLVLIELRGGNDGLNTWVPYAGQAAELYRRYRPTLALNPDQIIQLTDTSGLHPSLEPLAAFWQRGEMAVIEGLGYPQPNLSHFRSIEIWDTASHAHEYLTEGWLARAFALAAPPAHYLADAVSIGAGDLGPLAGGARTLAINSLEAFVRQARLAAPQGHSNNRALAHLLRLEADVHAAGARLDRTRAALTTEVPAHAFGQQVKTALELLAGSSGIAALRIGLGSFDTHRGQAGTHAALLKQLAEGIVALRAGLLELGRWRNTLILTYCEFGRRVRENASAGTDHGTANVQFAFGGALKAGLYGAAPNLAALDGTGNPPHTTDFRSLYATVLCAWWGLPTEVAERVLGGRYPQLGFV